MAPGEWVTLTGLRSRCVEPAGWAVHTTIRTRSMQQPRWLCTVCAYVKATTTGSLDLHSIFASLIPCLKRKKVNKKIRAMLTGSVTKSSVVACKAVEVLGERRWQIWGVGVGLEGEKEFSSFKQLSNDYWKNIIYDEEHSLCWCATARERRAGGGTIDVHVQGEITCAHVQDPLILNLSCCVGWWWGVLRRAHAPASSVTSSLPRLPAQTLRSIRRPTSPITKYRWWCHSTASPLQRV